jgi:hypothetical protein
LIIGISETRADQGKTFNAEAQRKTTEKFEIDPGDIELRRISFESANPVGSPQDDVKFNIKFRLKCELAGISDAGAVAYYNFADAIKFFATALEIGFKGA